MNKELRLREALELELDSTLSRKEEYVLECKEVRLREALEYVLDAVRISRKLTTPGEDVLEYILADIGKTARRALKG